MNINQKFLYQHVKMLSEKIGPRHFSSDSENATATYILKKFNSYGLETNNQTFSLKSFETKTHAKIVYPTVKEINTTLLIDLIHDNNKNIFIKAPVITMEMSINLKSKIVLLPSENFIPEYEIKKICKNNIKAILIYYKFSADSIKSPFFKDYIQKLRIFKYIKNIPVFLISENDANFIRKLLRNKKVIMEIGSLFSNQVKPSNNVIGKISDKGKEILICAHHDTYWGVLCPGATDNATGVASLLEIARIISLQSKTKNKYKTIKFVSFSSEEYFTTGSLIYCLPFLKKLLLLINPEIIYHFFKKLSLPKPSSLKNIELVINIDDAGNDGPLVMGVNCSLEKINRIFMLSNKNIKDIIKKHCENMKDEILYFENIIDGGDGIWFNKFKIPVISISRASTKYETYKHSTHDTIKLVNFENLKKTTNFIYELLKIFCF